MPCHRCSTAVCCPRATPTAPLQCAACLGETAGCGWECGLNVTELSGQYGTLGWGLGGADIVCESRDCGQCLCCGLAIVLHVTECVFPHISGFRCASRAFSLLLRVPTVPCAEITYQQELALSGIWASLLPGRCVNMSIVESVAAWIVKEGMWSLARFWKWRRFWVHVHTCSCG